MSVITDDELDFNDDERDYWEEQEGGGCYRCGGVGVIVTCIDDMCRGRGECMHGDGEEICPQCGGND